MGVHTQVTDFKTINGTSILGAGQDLTISTTGAEWGNITGTLSTQTDLQNALNLKQNILSEGAFVDGDKTKLDSALQSETNTSLSINANVLTYTDELGATTDIDLSLYLDDTNLARLVSGTLDGTTGIATFARDDATTFTVDMSALLDDTQVTVNNTLTSTSTTEALSANQGKVLDDTKITKVTSTDNAIVIFDGVDGNVKNSTMTFPDLQTYIGKAGAFTVSTDLLKAGSFNINWDGGVVPTGNAGAFTLTGLAGAVVGTWNKAYTAVQKVTSTDNAVVRFDGTDGTVKNSGVTIDDSDNLTAVNLTATGRLLATYITPKDSGQSVSVALTDVGTEVFRVFAGAGPSGIEMILAKSTGDVELGGRTLNIDATNKNVGIGTTSPGAKLEIGGNGEGIVLSSPNGTRYKITVDDSGNLVTTSV